MNTSRSFLLFNVHISCDFSNTRRHLGDCHVESDRTTQSLRLEVFKSGVFAAKHSTDLHIRHTWLYPARAYIDNICLARRDDRRWVWWRRTWSRLIAPSCLFRSTRTEGVASESEVTGTCLCQHTLIVPEAFSPQKIYGSSVWPKLGNKNSKVQVLFTPLGGITKLKIEQKSFGVTSAKGLFPKAMLGRFFETL
jgi:hypothetical protein